MEMDVYTNSPVKAMIVRIGTRRKDPRIMTQQKAELILDSLFAAEPRLWKEYGTYFAATTVPSSVPGKEDWIEFRVMESDRLHIEMVKSLGKYLK